MSLHSVSWRVNVSALDQTELIQDSVKWIAGEKSSIELSKDKSFHGAQQSTILAKNMKKTVTILNDNNFNNEDCVLIIRTFLNKSKRILKLISDYENNNNLDLTISSAKPPIFWKDKDIIKQQIYKWKLKNIKK